MAAPSRCPAGPCLNVFWLVLFAPVIWILTRLWKNDLPWMGEGGRRSARRH